MRAVLSAAVFTTGLFLSIAAVGAICSMLGYMLGTVPLWIALFVGLLFVWLGLQTAGIVKVAIPAVLPERFALKGLFGAFVLGAGYGLLSGPCTFGFLAPILAVAALPGSLATGLILLLCFAFGHCLPIAAAGCSSALCSAWLENRWAATAVKIGRPIAGLLIVSAGVFVLWAAL